MYVCTKLKDKFRVYNDILCVYKAFCDNPLIQVLQLSLVIQKLLFRNMKILT